LNVVEADLSVRDVNECVVTSENLKNQCDSRATCSNTEGRRHHSGVLCHLFAVLARVMCVTHSVDTI